MHPVLQYILGCVGAGAIGLVSASAVFLIDWLLRHRVETRLETKFAVAALVGLAITAGGHAVENRPLAAAGIVLCGWMVLPILLIPPILLWRFLAWCWRRFAE